MILKTPIEHYSKIIEVKSVQEHKFLFKTFDDLKALHNLVKKFGREILHKNPSQGVAIDVELLFVFHAQIFHKDYAQQEYLES